MNLNDLLFKSLMDYQNTSPQQPSVLPPASFNQQGIGGGNSQGNNFSQMPNMMDSLMNSMMQMGNVNPFQTAQSPIQPQTEAVAPGGNSQTLPPITFNFNQPSSFGSPGVQTPIQGQQVPSSNQGFGGQQAPAPQPAATSIQPTQQKPPAPVQQNKPPQGSPAGGSSPYGNTSISGFNNQNSSSTPENWSTQLSTPNYGSASFSNNQPPAPNNDNMSYYNSIGVDGGSYY